MRSDHLRILIISGIPLFPLMRAKGGYKGPYLGAKSFVDAGHLVYFVTCRPPIYYKDYDEQKPLDYVDDGIRISEFQVPFLNTLRKIRDRKLPRTKIGHYTQHAVQILCEYLILILFTLFAVRRGLKIARAIKLDVVYAFNEWAAAAAWIVAKACKVPNVTRLFGTFISSVSSSKFYKLRYPVGILGFKVPCDYLIVLNDGTHGDQVAKALKVPESRLKFWRDGINLDLYDPTIDRESAKRKYNIPRENRIVLAVNRLAPVKGIDRIVKAVPHVVKRETHVTFLIVGDGPERENLVALAKDLKVDPWIKFVGEVSHEEVKLFMNTADIYLSLHDLSQWSNATIEAMSTGRCLVALDDGSLDGFIKEGENGFLIKRDDYASLADRLVYLLRNEVVRERAGVRLRQKMLDTFQTWEQRNQAEIELVENLVARYKEKDGKEKAVYDFR